MLELLERSDEETGILEAIRRKYNISPERFIDGYNFATEVNDGKSRVEAYEIAFGVDKASATRSSTNLYRAKWIQDLIRYTMVPDEVQYVQNRTDVIKELMDIINDRLSSPREKTDAAKALQPYIKEVKIGINVEAELTVNQGEDKMTQFVDAITTLVGQNKMISNKGEIIDVEMME